MPKPTIGRIVHYRLSEGDCEAINRRRRDAAEHLSDHRANSNGVQVHVGNDAREGDYCPAVVVRTFGEHVAVVNLKVLLDGNDDYWATSRAEGSVPGTWAWPPRD